MEKKHNIKILPQHKTIKVKAGMVLLDALRQAEVEMFWMCSGAGKCGDCAVKVKHRVLEGFFWKKIFPCQFRIYGPSTIKLEKKKAGKLKTLKSPRLPCKFKTDPLVKRKAFNSGFSLILDNNDELLAVEKTSKKHIFGLAVDLGTTTICVSLCNLEDGEEVAEATILNSQSEFGTDLISRLAFAVKSKNNLLLLSEKAVSSINKAIEECLQKSGVEKDLIYCVVLVGNAVMHHFFLKIPVDNFVTPPYTITDKRLIRVKASELNLHIHPNANVYFLPPVEGFVGSDAVATLLVLKLHKSRKINLCVDLGTNGEIILGSAEKIFIASTAAGPAFEGFNIKCGMVAKSGAIEWLRIEKNPTPYRDDTDMQLLYKTCFLSIGHISPLGLCGSGIIDAVSELRREGIIEESGRMKIKSFLIYQDKNVFIELTDKDVREVQLAKAAICAGIMTLFKKLKISPEKINKVFLAGAFGNYLNAEHAVNIGLVPAKLKGKFEFAGNTAFLGAKLALLSKSEFRKTVELNAKISHVSLAEDKNFRGYFVESMKFPPTPENFAIHCRD